MSAVDAARSTPSLRRFGWTLLLVLALVLGLLVAMERPATAAPCDPPIVNPVACENTKAGNPPSQWDISGAGSSNLQGFATDISVDQGGTIGFKVDTTLSSFRIDVYRLGYYGGNGARQVASITNTIPRDQPNCLTQSSTGLIDCGNWSQSASWTVPSDAVSGIYIAKLVSGTSASHISFVVRDDDGGSALLFQTSDTTWQAYNEYGGNSLYTGQPAGRAYKISYNRPFTTRSDTSKDWLFAAEYPMLRFLERNGYDVSYTTGVDTHRRGELITQHDAFLSVGHDEYWSGQQRAHVEAARSAGVHLAFFSGNEVFWKTRWENSIDGSGTAHRTLVTYKETLADAIIDPSSEWTGTWRDPRFSPPKDGGRPENALTGQIFTVNCCTTNMTVGSAHRDLRFWRNTRVATLADGQTTTLGSGILGYEWDEDLDNGHRPPGLIRMSQTTVSGVDYLQNYGSQYSSGTATHRLTLYRHTSGALVFGAGTIQWAWGLDNEHDDGPATTADVAVQQATVNLFADMGVQPSTLMSGLSAAAASTDSTPPSSTITSPAAGSTIPVGQQVTVNGTATDAGGGVVGGVEVSVDGGLTWHPANGRGSWSYSFTPADAGTLTIRSRAADDSGRLETPSAGIQVTAGSGGGTPVSCPCSIWDASATPQIQSDPDSNAVELGVRFRAAEAGRILGIRYFKGSNNTGTHVGSLWTNSGTKLAEATFTGESASGWQEVRFSTPVDVSANTTYVASYYTPSGGYAKDQGYFSSTATVRGPLTALRDGADGPNGVYRYGTGGGFPTSTWQSTNYWVDVVYEPATDTTAPTVTTRTPASGATGVAPSTTVTATFSEAIQDGSTVVGLTTSGGIVVTGTTSYDSATRTVTFTPSGPLAASTTYTATVSGATDAAGNTMTQTSWSFTTEAPDTTAPTVTARTPVDSATGVAVSTTVTATFSEAIQEGSAVVGLTASGGIVVTGTTSYDSATRTVTFTPSALLSASTTYTATVSGAKDAAGNTMTQTSWSFTTAASDTTAPTVTARSPASGAIGVAVSTAVTATFSEAVQSSTIAFSLARTSDGAAVAAGTSYDAASSTVTLNPTQALAGTTQYTATLSGAKDLAGNTMTAVTWSFTTGAASNCPCTIWAPTATPAVAAQNDTSAVELGVKFRADRDGFVTGVRFYKGTGNGGAHVGRLWSGSGTNLAQATFSSETSTGWQQVTFASPVPITAGTTYVASYHAPQGRYALSNNYFGSSATTRGPLTALQNGTDGGNGVYRYGAGGGFPTNTWQSANYWVDVVFETSAADTTPPQVVDRTPVPDSTGVDVLTTVRATFNEDIQAGTAALSLTAPGGAAVQATTAYDSASRTVTLTPLAALAASTTYTARLSGARDAAGNEMEVMTWTFTTGTISGCPCTIFPATAIPGVASDADTSAVELGVKFRSDRAGYVTGLRFYKGSGNTGTHTGTLWRADGTGLASLTFTGETTTGWQEAAFGAPVPIQANTTYVASYHAPVGRYSTTGGGLTNGTTRGPLTALASGVDGPNGVYRYGASSFPTDSFGDTNYWVDVVFDTDATDTVAPTVTGRSPGAGQDGVPTEATVTATFSEAVQPSSVVFELRRPDGSLVPATTAYDPGTRTATLAPSSSLAHSTTYGATLSGAADAAGNVMAPQAWSFTTAAPPPPPPQEGPGGPIAVVTNGTDRFSGYSAEILRTEGLNEFTTVDVSTLSASTLSAYSVVLLGRTTLTSAQVSTLSNWVNSGGNLIAMRPDPALAPLLGLTPVTGTVAEGYLQVDTTVEPGAGITNEVIQFHGLADRYSLNGATRVATLYTSPTASTPNPAVTLRSVGSAGGQAAAFTYDLARSVVYTRQGNPAWAGQERDNDSGNVIRSNDMFFGGSSAPDWVNLGKVAIPQADEQQRLLANLIQLMNRDRMPLPRFWYFPENHKAVVIATGDDHANGGTAGRFNTYAANSPQGCALADWDCLRFTSYMYANSPMSNTQAGGYHDVGFELGLHPNTGCSNFTKSSLEQTFSTDLSAWRSKYSSLPSPVSNRTHCLVWSDWGSHFEVEQANGMRLDVNYYYWPGSWVQNRPGFMTGSGMPMRFARTDGTMADVYQATTQMTDESGQSYPFTPDTLLDRALGSLGYYGFFTANMHTDASTTFEDEALVASARARGVPIISARQALTWLDGRNGSAFRNLAWADGTLSFTIDVGSGADGLTAMVPTAGPGGQVLSTVNRSGAAVAFDRVTIKGVEYATLPAASGSYTVSYGAGAGTLQITAATADTGDAGTARLAWSTDEPATSEVFYGTSADELTESVVVEGAAGDHGVELEGLTAGETYYYRVSSESAEGTRTTYPAENRLPARLVTAEVDRSGPVVSDVDVRPQPDGTAVVTWRTDEPSDSTVFFGAAPRRLTDSRVHADLLTRHAVVLTRLEADSTYHLRVSSRDAAGNRSTGQETLRFVTPARGVADYTAVSFRTGETLGDARVVDEGLFGRITLGPDRVAKGAYVSQVFDAGTKVTWDRATWRASVPRGAGLDVSVRTGDTAEPDGTWSEWQPLARSGDRVDGASRFVQYRVELRASGSGASPALSSIALTNDAPERDDHGEEVG